jgi:hypothetical protein
MGCCVCMHMVEQWMYVRCEVFFAFVVVLVRRRWQCEVLLTLLGCIVMEVEFVSMLATIIAWLGMCNMPTTLMTTAAGMGVDI